MDPPYNLPGEAQRLFRRYQYLHHRIHSQARPLKIYFSAQSKEALLGWVRGVLHVSPSHLCSLTRTHTHSLLVLFVLPR